MGEGRGHGEGGQGTGGPLHGEKVGRGKGGKVGEGALDSARGRKRQETQRREILKTRLGLGGEDRGTGK
jgi:hypothetical protein